MPSFFDLQKFAATGIASADMSAYDKMRALAAFGGGKTQTLTGIPPLHFKANGQPLNEWSISGNTVQNGTPTSSAPVAVDGCGERTINLCPMSFSHSGVGDDLGNVVTMNTRLWSSKIGVLPSQGYYVMVSGEASNHEELLFNRIIQYDANGDFISRISVVNQATAEITTDANCRYIVLDIRTRTLSVDIDMADIDEVMVSAGAQAPYEPYGYKLPITCGGTTTPIYFGQTQTVRRVKKLVLTGQETWTYESGRTRFYMSIPDVLVGAARSIPIMSTHFVGVYDGRTESQVGNNSIYVAFNTNLYIKTTKYNSETAFTEYLQQQYAAGTPVTIWYALDTPETGIINEPLAKIGDYADTVASTNAGAPSIPTSKGSNTLSVGTTVQPSEVSITT